MLIEILMLKKAIFLAIEDQANYNIKIMVDVYLQ